MKSLRLISMIAVLLITVGLTGCFSSYPAAIEAYLKPDKVDVTTERYVLQPPDQIVINCSEVPEIHGQAHLIRPDGKISFEDIGEVEAAGRTPEQLANIIRGKVMEFYKLEGDNPVAVRIISYQSKKYYVLGQVAAPGPKVFSGRDTVFSALAFAQPTILAWADRIQVIRPSRDENVKAKIFEVNWDRMAAHGEQSKDVLLQEGDVIYVPPTILAAVAMKIEEFIRPLGRALSGAYMVERAGAGGYTGAGYYGGYGGGGY
ncbi:MAG: polysaccharide biosynthesis/export family protein [Sedimentisphaerales bacterium]|nr:polysaccharide biosynthesis/export family protein [Sedimentisphaerales bacterium]